GTGPVDPTVGLLVLAGCRISRSASPPSHPPPTVALAAVGDLLLDRGVGEKIERRGFDYPFAPVAGALRAADITFGNLECPLSVKGTKVIKRYCFQARPDTVECLLDGGFD